MTSEKYQLALLYATKKHSGQYRKGSKKIPYINHPINVANILQKLGESENIIIAGLLHDVVEDTPTPIEEIAESFGSDIAEIVFSVTEKGEGLSWYERLNKYVYKVKKSSYGAKMVCMADKIDNMRSMIECLQKEYNIFNDMKMSKEDQIKKFKLILDEFRNETSPEIVELYIKTLSNLIDMATV